MHTCSCEDCADTISKGSNRCPLCREIIQHVVRRIYWPDCSPLIIARIRMTTSGIQLSHSSPIPESIILALFFALEPSDLSFISAIYAPHTVLSSPRPQVVHLLDSVDSVSRSLFIILQCTWRKPNLWTSWKCLWWLWKDHSRRKYKDGWLSYRLYCHSRAAFTFPHSQPPILRKPSRH